MLRRIALLALVAAAAAAPGRAAGQEGADAAAAPIFTPRDHWSVAAARRLSAMGLMPHGFDPALDVQELGWLARSFAAAAPASPLAEAYLRRLEEELGPLVSGGSGPVGLARASVGGLWDRGRLDIGTGNLNESDWTGPIPVADRGSAVLGGDVYVGWGPLAGGASGRVAEDGGELHAAYAAAGLGPLGLVAGVRPLDFRPAPYGSLVFHEMPALPGAALYLRRPGRLPWLLSGLGPVTFQTFLVQGRRNYTFEDPWIWGMRVQLSPHPRVGLAVNRGVMFGGTGNTGLSLRTLAYLAVGKHSGEEGEYDNQVVSVSLRLRPPLGGVPVETFVEWGFDDSAGAWKDVPGVVYGAELAAVPGWEEGSVGVMGTWFAPSCCGNTIWYRNWSFRGGWADDGEPLGHPLGGHGREHRVFGRADLLDARVQLAPSVYVRHRYEENLLAPDREGASRGGDLGLTVLFGRWQGRLEGGVEVGESAVAGDWTRSSLSVEVRGRF